MFATAQKRTNYISRIIKNKKINECIQSVEKLKI